MADTPPSGGTPAPLPMPTLEIESELRDSYLAYAMSVIVSRALPDVRDGLKPSHRRILVAMNDLGLGPSSSTSKCAAIVGETMKRYHPHGDASIYDSLVRMTQNWALRYTLVHGQGNFGSIAGLPAAAHRYTEARLTNLAAEMLEDLNNDTVDFIDNYDGKYKEPLVLPSKVPNLLINGSDGIAVGMATEIPPHNLGEVCDALIALLENPNMSLGELISHIPGPDFPTGGIICGRQGIIDGYKTGRGKITLRARTEIVEEGKTTQIIIKEVPFQQTRNRLAEYIGELVKDERVKDISALRDESSARNGEPVRLVIDLKRGADPHLVLNQLYQFTPLQKTVSIILLALVDGRPRILTLKEMLEEFIKHRIQVIRRRTEYKLREAKRRGHILEGQLIAISSLDEVIRICRSSPNRSETKISLQNMEVSASVLGRAIGEKALTALQAELGVAESYRMTEAQADAVVRLQLGQLAALERDEIYKEYAQLREAIVGYETLLASEALIREVIKEDLTYLRNKFGDNRLTEISDEGAYVDMEDLIPVEDQVVSISHKGYIKRLPMDTYRVQHRGGKGVSGGTKDDDFVEHFFVASTHAYLLCFTNRGQLYWLKVYNIPEASRTSAGRSIANVLSLKPDEMITSVIPVRDFEGNFCLLAATRQGKVKKTPLEDYSRPKQGGIIGINLNEGDTLIGVCLVKPGDEVVLSSRNGMAIRFSESDARPMGRNTAGVWGINLKDDDELVGMVVADPEGFLLTICENGYGKRTPFGPNTADELPENGEEAVAEEPVEEESAEGEERSAMRYRKQRRGGKGVRDIRTSERNGKVIGIAAVKDTHELILMTMQGMVNRIKISEVRVVGRNTQGVRVMSVNDGDKIASLALVAAEEVVEEKVPATT
ncbi:DNA gyrase subunit A [Telmatocola sphagniphila]|uniref:DNA topoisomerase (ATP-hydrolyzing) n=1 Tax=Telmatocola sphagniphila TaxID=1123043 RepID=A0A8E6B6R1_9BACT|nr:DNA gyrase subunit A [Telmatocola sphagniphila]QVL32746.1 DNA gyrase subunit A [Telmatocola sphagniphila]